MKKTLKIAGFLMAGLLVLLTIILFAISSGSFNNWIADKVTQTASQQMNGKLNIENIEGNIFSHFTINKLSLQQKGKDLVLLDKLEIKYNPWAVLDKKIKIDLIHIKGLSVILKQESDSLWNLQKLFPQNNDINNDNNNDSLPDSFSWIIDLEKVQMSDFEASIESIDTSKLIPHSLKMDFSFSYAMSGNRMNLNLDEFKLSTKNPSIQINNFKFQAGLADSVCSWKNMKLQLNNTNIYSAGSIPLNQPGNSEFTLKALPLDFDELNDWFPMLYGKPQIELQVSHKLNKSNINFKLTQKSQSITILGQLANITSIPTYEFAMKIDSLNGEYWTHNKALKSNIKGSIDFKGRGFDLNNSSLNVKAHFPDLKYSNYEINNFLLSLEKEKDNLDGTVKVLTVYGDMDSKVHFKKIFTIPEYKALLELKRFNMAKLTGNEKLQSNINLSLQVYGQGIEPGKMKANVLLQSEKSVLFDYPISKLKANLDLNKAKFSGNLMANSIPGNLNAQINVEQLFSNPKYTFYGTFQNIDIAKITENDALQSNINLTIRAKGTGIDPKSLIAEIEMQSDSSTIFKMPVNDFSSRLNLNGENYLLNGFNIETPFILIRASGHGNLGKSNNIALSIDSKDIQTLTSVINQKDLHFAGQFTADVTGSLDSLNFLSKLNIEKFRFDSIQVGQIKGSSDMSFSTNGNFGWVDLQLNEAKFQKLEVKTIRLKSDLNKGIVNNDFTFQSSDSLKGKILSKLYLGKIPILYLPEINLNVYNNNWIGGSDNSFISFGHDSIEINRLSVTSGKSALSANGIFAFRGTESLDLKIENFNLLQIPELSIFPYRFSGNINALLDITGTAEKPVIEGNFNINKPEMDQLNYSSFNTSINYADENLKIVSILKKNESPLIFANIKIPVHFSFADSIFIRSNSELMQADINIDQLELSEFTPYIPIKGMEAKGLLSLNMNIANTINNPNVKGKFKLSNGLVNYKKLGIDYNKIEIRSQLNNNLFSLDSLHLFSGKGNLKMDGSVEFDSLLNGKVKKIDLNLRGKNFRAFNSEMIKAVIDADLSVKGDDDHSVFNGNLSILSSTLNADLLSKEYSGVSEDFEQPLLVKAREEAQSNEKVIQQTSEKTEEKAESIKINYKIKKDSISKASPDIYKNLTGQFGIDIPRNSWIKGKNMNFELAGKVKAIKEGDQINFYGDLNIKRGYYKIYGRKLEVEEGKITLTGGQITNPVVDFIIAYKFRDPENLLRKLNLNVSGRVSKPKIEFYLDDVAVEEKEAISYLMFNKSPDQLDTRETASANNSNADIVKDMAIGQLSNAMKDVLQSSFGLDVFEFSGKGGGTKGSVSIGKYITNNLYLNYERSFSLDKKDKIIEPEKISMEYQIYRSLFLQATNQGTNSGFDFILKWKWK